MLTTLPFVPLGPRYRICGPTGRAKFKELTGWLRRRTRRPECLKIIIGDLQCNRESRKQFRESIDVPAEAIKSYTNASRTKERRKRRGVGRPVASWHQRNSPIQACPGQGSKNKVSSGSWTCCVRTDSEPPVTVSCPETGCHWPWQRDLTRSSATAAEAPPAIPLSVPAIPRASAKTTVILAGNAGGLVN